MKWSIIRTLFLITISIVLLSGVVMFLIFSNMLQGLVSDVYSNYVSYASAFGAMFIDSSVYEENNSQAEAPADPSKGLLQFTPDPSEKAAFKEAYDELLKVMCDTYNLKYVYIIKPDVQNGDVKYLSLASSEESKTGTIGDVKVGTVKHRELTPGEKSAFEGTPNSLEEADNKYGHVMSCFNPLVNSETGEIDALIGADVSLEEVENTYNRILGSCFIILSIIFALMLTLLYVLLRLKLVKPVVIISRKMLEFTETHDSEKCRMKVKGKDEFAQMAQSFNSMTDEINRYISDIEELNREKHRRETELSIAAGIQSGLLPQKYSVMKSAVVKASMKPARDVGGDFYDYIEMPDGKICTCIADVSGKGISAALFMSRTITIIRQAALMGYSPKEILDSSNKSVCSYNTNMMFVTVFVGVYDPVTRKLTYSNAGHNIPYIISDKLIGLEDGKSAAIGLFDDEEYENAEIELKPGDSLFLYTDGLNEAVSAEHKFFGTERLEKELTSLDKEQRKDSIEQMEKALRDFVGDAEQSDDVTMLSMTICSHHELTLEPDKKELKRINEIILTDPYIPKTMRKKLCLVAEEIFVNICSYAFDGERKPVSFCMDTNDKTVMVFKDSGKQYDPLKESRDSVDDYDIEHEVGGLGVFLTKTIAQDCRYEYKDNQNILTITF